jgi:prepilin-type N-terminal cleavage/methylation domain-containing protein
MRTLEKIKYWFREKYKKHNTSNGFTLVEVIIAILLIALLAVGLIQGTSVAVDAVKLNKEKTKASAVANEKIETIRAMAYEDIGLTSDDPGWETEFPQLSESGYSIAYYSSWVDDEVDNYKQVKVTVFNSELNVPVEVVTRIYPALSGTSESEPGYPHLRI